MDEQKNPDPASEASPADPGMAPPAPRTRWSGKLFRAVLVAVILTVGVTGAAYLKSTAPQPQRRAPRPIVTLVETMPLERADAATVIQAMGTVTAARELVVKSRVAGEIVEIHPDFIEGGLVPAGAALVRIDDADYRLDVVQKQSQVAAARYALKLELGHQDVAKREWQLINKGRPADPLDAALALRKPHLEKVKADLAAAEAALARARLDRERTTITAPFNAVVRSRGVEVGSQITAQAAIGELVGTDAYWIEASVPLENLSWMTIPRTEGDAGSPVRIHYGDGLNQRSGVVIKLMSELTTDGRMARVLVSVSDPLNLSGEPGDLPPLLIGEYVRLDIMGRELKEVFAIPRDALRDGDTVWIAAPGDRLTIRPVTPVWRNTKSVFIREGLAEGERLILSEIAGPVEGMAIQMADAPAAGSGGGKPPVTG